MFSADFAEETKLKIYRNASVVVLISAGIIGFLQSQLESMLLPLVVLVLQRWRYKKSLPFRWITVGVFLFLVLNPLKGEFRTIVREDEIGKSGSLATNITQRLDIWNNIISNSASGESRVTSEEGSLITSRKRFSALLPVAQSLELVPDTVEYAYGKLWTPILYTWVPRLLWEDKPDLTKISNGWYAVTFGYLSEAGTQNTAIDIPQMVDGYWNFGWGGIILVAALIGICIGFQSSVFTTQSWALCATGIVFLIQIRAQSDLNSSILGLSQRYIGVLIFFGFLYFGGQVLSTRRLGTASSA